MAERSSKLVWLQPMHAMLIVLPGIPLTSMEKSTVFGSISEKKAFSCVVLSVFTNLARVPFRYALSSASSAIIWSDVLSHSDFCTFGVKKNVSEASSMIDATIASNIFAKPFILIPCDSHLDFYYVSVTALSGHDAESRCLELLPYLCYHRRAAYNLWQAVQWRVVQVRNLYYDVLAFKSEFLSCKLVV